MPGFWQHGCTAPVLTSSTQCDRLAAAEKMVVRMVNPRASVTRSGLTETVFGRKGPRAPTHVRAKPPWGIAAAFLLGAFAILGLPPFSVPPVLAVTFSGAILVLEGERPGRAFLIGWAFGLGFFLAGIHWIGESFTVDRDRFGWMALPAVVGLSAFLALFPALAAVSHARLRARGVPAIILFAVLWTGTEWLRGHVLTGFPWNLIGYAWVDFAPPRQAAALVGSYGLSFLTVLAAALPAAIVGAGMSRRGRCQAALLLIGVVAGLWLGGLARLESLRSASEASEATRIRIVQGNIAQTAKWNPELRAAIIERYLDLSARDPARYDLLLWPETALPVLLDEAPALLDRIASVLPKGAVLLAGAVRRSGEAEEPTSWNSNGRGRAIYG